MASFTKAAILFTIVFPLTSATQCKEGSCDTQNDETSLLQVESNVKKHSERAEPAFIPGLGLGAGAADLGAGALTDGPGAVGAGVLSSAVGASGISGVVPNAGLTAAALAGAAPDTLQQVVPGIGLAGIAGHGPLAPNPLAADTHLGGIGSTLGARATMEGDLPSMPTVNYKAIRDSMPGTFGEVQKAFSENELKVADDIRDQMLSDLKFARKVREERRKNHEKAMANVKHDKEVLKKVLKQDQAMVDETAHQRKMIVDDALNRIKKAKEEKIAHEIKKQQTQRAAILGRVVGQIEGQDMAKHALASYKEELAQEAAEKKRAEERHKKEEVEAARRAAIDKETKRLADLDKAWADSVRTKAETIAEKAHAQAAVAQARIQGAEGLKNRITDTKAELAAKHFHWDAEQDQKKIEQAKDAIWPVESWAPLQDHLAA